MLTAVDSDTKKNQQFHMHAELLTLEPSAQYFDTVNGGDLDMDIIRFL